MGTRMETTLCSCWELMCSSVQSPLEQLPLLPSDFRESRRANKQNSNRIRSTFEKAQVGAREKEEHPWVPRKAGTT